MRQKLENDSIHFVQVQEETLLKILKSNAVTEYGQKYNFCDIHNKVKYVTVHPLTRYDHYESYVGRGAYHKTTGFRRTILVHNCKQNGCG